jgi:DNA-binding NarL/FixJ family response regulator
LFESIANVTVIAEAATGRHALQQCEEHAPDVLVIDLGLPDIDGVDVIREVHQQQPGVAVLALTVQAEDATIVDAIVAGASGYLLKSSTLDEISAALEAVVAGGVFMTADVNRALINALGRPAPGSDDGGDDLLDLTDLGRPITQRERDVLELLGQGLSTRRIAMTLGLSTPTVNTHLAHLYRKLDVVTRVDAILEGMRRGILDAPR